MRKELALEEIATEINVRIPQYKVCTLINEYFEKNNIEKKVYQNSDKDLVVAFNNNLEDYLLCASDIDGTDRFVVMEGAVGHSVFDWDEVVSKEAITEYIYNNWNDFSHYFNFDISDPGYDEE